MVDLFYYQRRNSRPYFKNWICSFLIKSDNKGNHIDIGGIKLAKVPYKWSFIMQQSDQDEGFIGPIKPLMSMSYRDYLHMINTGLGLPRLPNRKTPVVKKDEDYLFPPADYKLN